MFNLSMASSRSSGSSHRESAVKSVTKSHGTHTGSSSVTKLTGGKRFSNGDNSLMSMSSPVTEDGFTSGSHPWKHCVLCCDLAAFTNPKSFIHHLKSLHCTQEGGSFICHYAANGTCSALPIEGVSEADYNDHVAKEHVYKGLPPLVTQSRQVSPAATGADTANNLRSEDAKKPAWTIFDCTQNLTAVLNDPRIRRETDLFTKSWGDSFEKTDVGVSPFVVDIDRDDFKAYLDEVASKMRQKQKDNKLVPLNKHDKLARSRKANFRVLPEELNQIPEIFFESEFNLQDQNTFGAVVPWEEVGGSLNPETGKVATQSCSHRLYQEKLSHYLDIIEIAISKQIQHRAESFFHAMSSHDVVQDNLMFTCLKTKALREQLQKSQRDLVYEPLKLLQTRIKRCNYVKLYNKLKLMATVYQTQPTVQILLSTSEFVGALDLIDTTKDVLVQELTGIHCFRHLSSQLMELESLIDKMMTSEFARHIAQDLMRPAECGHGVRDEDQLVTLMLGMVRQHKFTFTDTYREEACTALKALLKQTVIQAVSRINSRGDNGDVDGSAISLAKEVSQLNFDQWLELIEEMFSNLTVLMRRVTAAHGVMQEVADTAVRVEEEPSLEGDHPVFTEGGGDECGEEMSTVQRHMSINIYNDTGIVISADEHSAFTTSITNMLKSFCDQLGERASRIISARFKDNYAEKMPVNDFLSVFRTVNSFYLECETISGYRIKTLTAVLQSETSRFVNKFHDEKKKKLGLILDSEYWKQADVPIEFQNLVDSIGESGEIVVPKADNPKSSGDREVLQCLMVGEERFVVIGTVLILLKMVVEYCRCSVDIPYSTADFLMHLVDLLKTFNSRSCQLILGAGALQKVGLKTITTRNLALCSRCLELILHFLPLVHAHFRAKLGAKQQHFLQQLRQVEQDYRDHVNEIFNKLVLIMDSMLNHSLSRWEVKAPVPSPAVRSLCRQISMLHDAVHDLLSVDQTNQLMSKITLSFKSRIKDQLSKQNVRNDGGPQHALVSSELSFYNTNLRNLNGFHTVEIDWSDVWR